MTRVRRAARTTFHSLRYRNFRVFFVGQAISQTGTWLQLIAQSLLVLKLKDSGIALGLLVVFQFLPVLVIGPWAGVLADRFDRRRTMLITQTVMMVQAAAFAVLVLTGAITLPIVFALALVTGIANAIDTTARRVIVTELVDGPDLPNAIGLNSMLMTSSRLVGPALAGLTIVTVGIGWCFALNAVSFVAVLFALVRLDMPPAAKRVVASTSAGRQLVDGLRYVWADPDLRIAMSLMAVVSTLAFNWQVVLPLFAIKSLDGNATTYTVLTSILSVGSLVGAVAVAHRQRTSVPLLIGSAAAFGASTLVLAAMPTLITAIPAAIVAGGTGIFFLSSTSTFVQTNCEPAMIGRVVSLHTVLFLGSTPIGGPIAGWVSQEFGPRSGLLLGAIPTLVAAAILAHSLSARRGGTVPAWSSATSS